MFYSTPAGGVAHGGRSQQSYAAGVARSAHDVAAVLRARLPGLATVKLHKLLYYCQGHHLAAFSRPLFGDVVSAWDMGPVIGTLWYAEKHGEVPPPSAVTDEAALNTIGYVVSRYGGLSGTDLVNLSHGEGPWREADRARRTGTAVPIPLSWMEQYFRTVAVDDDTVFDAAAVAEWLSDAEQSRDVPASPDSPAELASRLEDLRVRVRRLGAG